MSSHSEAKRYGHLSPAQRAYAKARYAGPSFILLTSHRHLAVFSRNTYVTTLTLHETYKHARPYNRDAMYSVQQLSPDAREAMYRHWLENGQKGFETPYIKQWGRLLVGSPRGMMAGLELHSTFGDAVRHPRDGERLFTATKLDTKQVAGMEQGYFNSELERLERG